MSFIVLDAVRAAKEAVLSKLAELLTAAQGTGIKSVQRLRITTPESGYVDVTISSVNPLKTFLICRWGITAGPYFLNQDCELVNATTIRCSGNKSGTTGTTGIVDVQIVEFK